MASLACLLHRPPPPTLACLGPLRSPQSTNSARPPAGRYSNLTFSLVALYFGCAALAYCLSWHALSAELLGGILPHMLPVLFSSTLYLLVAWYLLIFDPQLGWKSLPPSAFHK